MIVSLIFSIDIARPGKKGEQNKERINYYMRTRWICILVLQNYDHHQFKFDRSN